MKVLQTISGLSAKFGGPSTCTFDLLTGLNNIKAAVNLLTVSTEDILGKGSTWLKAVPNDCITPLGLSKNIRRELENSNYDLYHVNALWSYICHVTCVISREKGKPYIISPHGMLYPTALAFRRWKKIPMLKLWFNKDIMQATCLHATCIPEMEYCREFGYKGPIAVIPNAVVFPEGVELKVNNVRDAKGRKRIGFLGRLHPIKKIEQVLYALDILKSEGLEIEKCLSFEIMGKYDDDYEKWLKCEVKRLGLEGCVEFVGFVSGKEKYDRLANLFALMVPSTQENFGMIVPEALICGTPVYASLGTPWSELNAHDAGWWKDNNPSTIAEVIKEILSLSDEKLYQKGKNGRKLIEEKYEQHRVACMMKQLYDWIYLGMKDENKPEFVYSRVL